MTIGPIARRIPIIGNTVYNVGQLIDVAMTPCNAEPEIMVYAFFNYIPRLVWTLYKPDPIDYVSDRFSDFHSRKRKRRVRIEDITIGKGGSSGQLAWWSFKGAQFAQRLGWYVLVVDATAEFLVNWTSMAMVFSGCEVPNTPYQFNRRRGLGDAGQSLSALGRTVGNYNERGGIPTLPGAVSVNTQGTGPFMLTFGCDVTAIAPGTTVTKFDLFKGGAGGGVVSQLDLSQNPQVGQRLNLNAKNYNGELMISTFQARAFGSGSGLRINNQSLTITQTLDPGFEPDP